MKKRKRIRIQLMIYETSLRATFNNVNGELKILSLGGKQSMEYILKDGEGYICGSCHW
jgi:hypothetical protein